MNNFKLPAIVLICVLILSQSLALVYLTNKSGNLSKELKSSQPERERIIKEEAELKNKYESLLGELDAIKRDRNNLLAQAKNLLVDRGKATELEASLDKVKKERDSLDKEKQDLQTYDLSLKEELKKLQEAQAQITKERDDYKSAYEKARKDTLIKELNGKISALEREKNNLQADLKQARKENAQLLERRTKLEAENEQLSRQLNDLKKNYAAAVDKNKALEQHIKNMPKKFSEMARQNKMLIKETAQIHYNLGVFYTKNKEYERAIAEFEKVIDINPDDSDAHFNLGYIYAEYLVNRKKAIENFRHFLRLAKGDDRDVDWARKYLLTWETYEGKSVMK